MTEREFAQLIKAHRKYAIRVLSDNVMRGRVGDYDDVIQISTIKAWGAIESLEGSFKNWYLRIVANTARDFIKSGGWFTNAEPYFETSDEYTCLPAEGEDPLEHLEREELLGILSRSLSRLSREDRDLLLEPYVSDSSKDRMRAMRRRVVLRNQIQSSLRRRGHTLESLTVGTPKGTTKKRAVAEASRLASTTRKPQIVYRTRSGWFHRHQSEKPVLYPLHWFWILAESA